jgi:hypothetical protein
MNRDWKFALLALALMVFFSAGGMAQSNSGPQLPPLKSPVDVFRELLNLSPAARVQALADRSEVSRARLLEKLREYQALDPDECELRLRATELRSWLLPLMRQPATNRAASLSLIPAHLHQLIEGRLQVWDLLPPDLQQEFLDNEDVAQLFLQLQGRTASQRESILNRLSPERRRLLEQGLERWTTMSDAERRLTCERFDRYFELSQREREKVLLTLSETERQQMAETLRSFEQLPREKRIVCVRSFAKFASMGVAERQQFLKNAERWEKMSPAERQTWRNLVSRVPEFPPLPPGFGEMPPPLPPSLQNSPRSPITNGGG